MMQWRIERRAEVDSTMESARELAGRGAGEGTVIVAESQLRGRGRHGNAWYATPGESLTFSVLLRPALAPAQLGWLTMSAALAVREALVDVTAGADTDIGIKWFNDVLLRGRKVCGILVETSLTGERVDCAVLGIGVNVNTRFDDAPPGVRERATSLREAFGRSFDREAVLQAVLARLAARYAALRPEGRSPAAEYARHVVTLGAQARVRQGDDLVEGVATGIADDGSLILSRAGVETRVTYGDVAT